MRKRLNYNFNSGFRLLCLQKSVNNFGVNVTVLFLFLIYSGLSAQITISNQGGTAASIVAGFIGQGVTFSNATINCAPTGYGTFSNGNTTNLGLNTGALLTTGDLSQITGAPSDFVNSNEGRTCNDPELTTLEPTAQNDCCVLEFDIIPKCDQLSIRFVFGSEEYPEFVNASFNDAFGFFVSGPNPSGGNYVNQNVAVLPNGVVVGIDNINATSNAAYYINNTGTSIAFDGLTTSITSTINLIPCQTYHFKLAIADASDHLYDSGVFIDFIQCTKVMSLNINSNKPSCGKADGSANVVVSNGFPNFTYTWSPAPPLGQGTPAISGLSGGQTYTVVVDDAYTCIPPDSAMVTIDGVSPLSILVNSSAICSGSSALLTASVSPSGGAFSWTPGAQTSAVISVSPLTSTTYTCSYTLNGCVLIDSATITVNPIPKLTTNNAVMCAGSSVNLQVSGANTFTWLPLTGLSAGTGAAVVASPSITTNYTVVGTSNGCSATTNVNVTVNPVPVLTVNSDTICEGNSTILNVSGAVSYSWSPSAGLSATSGASVSANPITSTIYTVTGTSNGCSNTAIATVTVNSIPVITVNNDTICEGSSATLTANGALSYTWSPAIGLNATLGSTVLASPASSTIYTVTGTSFGCSGTASATVLVKIVPSLNALNDEVICSNASTTPTNFISVPSGAVFDWTNSNTAIGLVASGSGNINSFVAQNNSLTVNTALIKVYPKLYGCVGLPQDYTITVHPIPLMNAFANIDVCNSIAVNAPAFSSLPAGASYTWFNNNTAIGLPGGGNGNLPPFTATNSITSSISGMVTVSPTLNGCAGNSYTFSIHVKPTPGSPVAHDTSYCLNATTVPLQAQASLNGSLNWYGTFPLGGTPSVMAPVPSAAVANTTNYYVSQTVDGCEGPRKQIQVTINNPPAANIPANVIACNADSVPVSVLTSTPPGASFTWFASNTGIGLQATGSGNVPGFIAVNNAIQPSNSIISIVPSIFGCKGNAVSYSITVNPQPLVMLNNLVFCNKDTVPATVISSIPVGASYSWVNSNTSIGLAASDTGNVPGFVANNAAPGPVTATVTVTPKLNGCKGVPTNFTIKILPTPPAPIAIDKDYCKNSVSNPLTAFGNGTLLWYATAIAGTASAISPVPLTDSVGTFYYYVSQTVNNCVSNRDTVKVRVFALPEGTLSAPVSGCPPLCGNFLLSCSSPPKSCVWDMGDHSTIQGDTLIQQYCYNVSGSYDVAVTIIDNNNCKNLLSFDNWVNVLEAPKAAFVYTPLDGTATSPNILFQDKSIGNNIVVSYWQFGDSANTSSLEPNVLHAYSNPGNYTVQLVSINNLGCRDTVYNTVFIEDGFALYVPTAFSPNGDGVNDEFFPKGLGLDEDYFFLWIYDRWGNMVFFTKNFNSTWDGIVMGIGSEPVQQDLFVWKIKCKDYKGEKHQYTGTLTVIR